MEIIRNLRESLNQKNGMKTLFFSLECRNFEWTMPICVLHVAPQKNCLYKNDKFMTYDVKHLGEIEDGRLKVLLFSIAHKQSACIN